MLSSLSDMGADFAAFHSRFSGLFARSEPREECAKYLRGLMAEVARKNGWGLARRMGEDRPDAVQRLLYQAQWDQEEARDILQQFVIEKFGEPEGIGVIDETGFVKWGDESVGVQRQYTGTAGTITNCQVAVFLSYATSKGHVFLDRRLYLPEKWCQDRGRRKKAGVPEEVEFATRQQLALEMLEHAWEQGVPMKWVVGDEVYGDTGYFRRGISGHKRRYVLTVSVSTLVWLERPQVEPEERSASGRLRRKARLAEGAAAPICVADVAHSWPADRWERLTVAEGQKGPIVYDWAPQRVVESQEGLPGEDVWLLVRRSVKDPTEMAYYLSNAPEDTSLRTLAEVATARWTIEQCFREAKSETGLDEYEVRLWHSWYRHITLVMMAHAWLASVRSRLARKKGLCAQAIAAESSTLPT